MEQSVSGMTETGRRIFTHLVRFFRTGGLWWGLAVSIVLAFGSLALATTVVVSWRPDRFNREAGPSTAHPLLRALALVGKNLGGLVMVLLGLVMALPGIPGQGLLTMIIGMTLLDFPGKRGLERRVLRRPRVLHGINRLRARFGRPPLEID